jgi:prolyl-tRNA editing enzyme YbaK/EbsC (Cys-tRNA(Pro) deacylase)
MDDPVQRVDAALRAKGLAGQIVTLPEAAPTAAAAAEQLGCEVGAIANSLIFSVAGEPLLVMTSGAHRVDTRHIASLLGVRKVSRADPAFVLAATGQEAGGVAPAGHPAPIRTLVDVWLDRYPEVWAGAGLPHTIFPLTYKELLLLTGGEPVEVARPDR